MIGNIKTRAIRRTKIIEGQVRGLQKMINNEEYCVDILTQSLAIQKSLSSLNKLLLENHVRTHIATGMESGNTKTKEKLIEEMLSLYELYNIRGQ